jgi:hypothetical protein
MRELHALSIYGMVEIEKIGQNNSLIASQILIECQFTKLKAGSNQQP